MPPPLSSRWSCENAKKVSVLVLIVGIALFGLGLLGWLMGDLNLESLRPIAAEVYAARVEARSFEIPITGTVDLFGEGRGTVPIKLLSSVMNNAIIIMIVGIALVFNAIMLRIQSWESMKDLFCVQPALFFFMLFVYFPVIDLVRISLTDMRMLVTDPQNLSGCATTSGCFCSQGGIGSVSPY